MTEKSSRLLPKAYQIPSMEAVLGDNDQGLEVNRTDEDNQLLVRRNGAAALDALKVEGSNRHESMGVATLSASLSPTGYETERERIVHSVIGDSVEDDGPVVKIDAQTTVTPDTLAIDRKKPELDAVTYDMNS